MNRTTVIAATVIAATGITAASLLGATQAAAAPAPGTIFINFDGPALHSTAVDDASVDGTAIAELARAVQPFGGDGPQRQAVLEAVRADFAPFDVRVVDTRPGSGDYMMAVVTPDNPFGDGVSGAAITDCFDQAGRRDVVFAFFAAGDAPALDVASTISQEVGHALGLEHVDDAADVLYPFATGFDPYFNDTCLALSSAATCAQQHAAFCDRDDEQNSYAELLAAFGSSTDDSTPPTVALFGPDDGDALPVGRDIELTVEADDDQRVDRVVLYEGGDAVGEDRVAPYTFTVVDIEEGQYEVYAVATDAAGNETMSEVLELTAQPAGIPAGGGTPPVPTTPRGAAADQGCTVGARPLRPTAAALGLGFLLLAAARCRRSAPR